MALVDEVSRHLGSEVEYSFFGWWGEYPQYPECSGRIAASRFFPTRLWRMVSPGTLREIRRCQLVIDVGEGDSFSDIYGDHRFRAQVLSKILVWAARRPLVLAPQTIGPFAKPFNKFLATLALRCASEVFARDDQSARFACELTGREVQTVTDLAMALPYQSPASRSTDRPLIGINVSGLLYRGGYDRANQFGLECDYPRLCGEMCAAFISLGCDVELVSHVHSRHLAVEDDHAACLALAEEFPSVVVVPPFASPIEAKSRIAGYDFFVGARMHACIAAFSAQVPVVALAYSRKFDGVFGTLGYREVIDLRSTSAESVLNGVLSAFSRRADLEADLSVGVSAAKARLALYREALIRKIRSVLP